MSSSLRKTVYYIIALLSIVLVIYAISHKDKLGYVNNNTATSTDVSSTDNTEATPPLSFAPGQAVLGDWILNLEIADTPEKQEKGLSGRASLDPDSGMLFVFPEPQAPGFWMKDMKFPLDFIWFNKDGEIVEVLPNISPSTYPEIYTPLEPIKYVLEINAGQAKVHGLGVGDVLSQTEE